MINSMTSEVEVKSDYVRIIPLGGLGEVGMNCLLLEYKDSRIMIDCGVMFPEDEIGINVICPDFSYLRQKHLDAVILTHAHDDHIGAVPYLLREISAPIWSQRFSLGILKEKLKEHRLVNNTELCIFEPYKTISIGDFQITSYPVAHSTSESMGLVIKTDNFTIVHSGDYKFGYPTKEDGITNIDKIKEITGPEVDLLLADSTNVEQKGQSGSEKDLKQHIKEIVSKAEGKVFLSVFSSSIPRIQSILDVAYETGRYVTIIGRSMKMSINIATGLGLLKYPSSIMVNIDDTYDMSPNELMYLVSGTQGEPNSSLKRLSLNQIRKVKVNKGDYVILSSRFIPGNELQIYRTISDLTRLEAKVIHQRIDPLIHVSGHAYRDEQIKMLNLLKPKFFIPIHGNYHYLKLHKNLAEEAGVKNSYVIENGDVVELSSYGLYKIETIPVGKVYIDGHDGYIDENILKERKNIALTGVISVAIVVDTQEGELLLKPRVISKGVFLENENTKLDEMLSNLINKAYDESHPQIKRDTSQIKDMARKTINRYFLKKYNCKPLTVISVITIDDFN